MCDVVRLSSRVGCDRLAPLSYDSFDGILVTLIKSQISTKSIQT